MRISHFLTLVKLHECERQNMILTKALQDRKENEVAHSEFTQKQQVEAQTRLAEAETALRQTRSRNASLEAEVSLLRTETISLKTTLSDSERAVAMLKEKVKSLDEQIRLIEPKARDVQRVHELVLEVDQVHAEKAKLRELLQKANEENRNLKAQVETAQEGRLLGVLCV